MDFFSRAIGVSALAVLLAGPGCTELDPTGPGVKDPSAGNDDDDDDDIAGDDDATEAPLEISQLEIQDNPGNPLSCTVRWRTNAQASSYVLFGESLDHEFYAGNEDQVTQHEVLVFGLHAETRYHLQASSTTRDGEVATSSDQTYETGPLPFGEIRFEVDVLDEPRVQAGWTLLNLAVWDALSPTIAVMVDMDGEVVWYHDMGSKEGSADVVVTLEDGDRVLIGGGIPPGSCACEVDLAGEILWKGPEQLVPWGVSGHMHHAFQKVSNGDYVSLVFDYQEGTIHDVISQFDASGEVVWTWETREHLPDAGQIGQKGNMAAVLLDDGGAYYHDRTQNLLYYIDHASKEIAWSYGVGGDFEMAEGHEDPWFSSAHSPEFLDNGNLLVYDNGDYERGFSRVMEYEIDLEDRTTRVVWEYPGSLTDDPWFNPSLGDADRLDNGNTLVVVGTLNEDEGPSRLFEVTPDGALVWQMWLWTEDDGARGLAGSYAAQRIPVLTNTIATTPRVP
jgi:hypothetical protein